MDSRYILFFIKLHMLMVSWKIQIVFQFLNL